MSLVMIQGMKIDATKEWHESYPYYNERMAFQIHLHYFYRGNDQVIKRSKEFSVMHTNMLMFGARYKEEDERMIMRLRTEYNETL